MVGTRRNKSTGGNDPDPESNKPKKLTKAQLKQMDDILPLEASVIQSVDAVEPRTSSSLGRRLTKAQQKQMDPLPQELEVVRASPVSVPGKRGRPRKHVEVKPEENVTKEPKKRGRPRKSESILEPTQNKTIEQIKSDETDTGSSSSGSNSNSPANRRISNRLKKKMSEEETSEIKDETTFVPPSEEEISNQEEAASEELIEIVVEEHTRSSIDSNEAEQADSPIVSATAVEDEFDPNETSSPEIRVEIMEDSNSMVSDTENLDKSNKSSQIQSKNDENDEKCNEITSVTEMEDEVSIVYLDENDTIMDEDAEPPQLLSDSDATMDSVDLGIRPPSRKSKRMTKKQLAQERAFERLKIDEKVEVQTIKEEIKEEIDASGVEALEKEVENIKIEEEKLEEEEKIEKIEKVEIEEKNETLNTDNSNEKIYDSETPTSEILIEKTPSDENSSIKEQTEEENSTSIRRSNRIKTISTQNRRSVGHGLVKDREKFLINKQKSDEKLSGGSSDPLKVKSRWRRLSEIEAGIRPDESQHAPEKTKEEIEEELRQQRICEERLKHFVTIKENEYKCDRNISKEAKKMLCDCFLTQEEYERGELGCGEDCLNRLLMIECGPKCNIGSRCTNKRFQNAEYAKCKVFRTEKKGFGIAAAREIQPNEFIMEYVGEVLDSEQFEKRANDYSNEKNKHYYFMALRSDAVIDATTRGNISRFINHSCDPNAETQKWTVNGELRIGFFSTRFIPAGEEITFDYQFQRYGKEAQKCYCEAANCRGWIGQGPGEEESDVESGSEESEASDAEKEEVSVEEKAKIEKQKTIEKEIKEKAKVARKKRAYRRKKRQEILDDLDLDDEIGILCRTGLKNQQHTLKLSRLMVRAKVLEARSRLLSLLKNGELPCRRLFLDYHGLRLLHGWMEDTQDTDQERLLNFRKSILEVLEVLPISNKTILKDSKVLSTVQKWASEHDTSPNSSSPNDESSGSGTATPLEQTETSKQATTFNSEMFKHIPEIIKQSEQLMKTIGVDELKHIINSCGEIREHVKKEKEEKSKLKMGENVKETDESSNQEPEKNIFEEIKAVDDQKLKKQPSDEEKLASETSSDTPTEVVPKNDETKDSEEITSKVEIASETTSDAPKQESKNAETKDSEEITSKVEIASETTSDAPKQEIVDEKPQTSESPPNEIDIEFKDLKNEICQLAKKLLGVWKDLKEIFRIPKKERIEQMKEHEREADLRYKALKLDNEQHKKDRYTSSRYRDTKDRERYESRDSSYVSSKVPKEKYLLSKEQRRALFEMKVAQQEHERRQQELISCHEQNCMKFGLNPRHTSLNDVPAMMNPITGQYYAIDRRPLPTPPSHQYMKFIPPPLPTNPAEYELPPLDLPPMWKFAIDERGRIYYYHVKIRIPQWNPPIKIQPLSEPNNDELQDDDIQLSDEGSESSTTDTCDSEEEELKEKLEILQQCKEKSKTQFNLDDLLAKPSDINEIEDPEKRLSMIPSAEDTNILLGAQNKAEILNAASNFNRSLDKILPNIKRIQRKRSGLVQQRSISPRTEEDKIRGHQEMRRYKETKEKLRKRKEEAKRKQLAENADAQSGEFTFPPDIVDELDILCSSETKRPSAYEEWQAQKIRLEKKRKQLETTTDERSIHKRKKDAAIDLHGEEARKIKDKFRTDISGVIVHHLRSYMKEDCQIGRITNNDDFKHLARKLTHFVMLKELKHCGNTIGHLEVTDSVKVKAREFIKKYMAKYDPVYVKPENEPDFKE